MSTRTVLAACLFVAVVPAFGQNLLVNGDFSLSVPSSGFGNGWTASGGIDGAGGWTSTGGNPGGAFILNAGGGVPHPTISQVVTGLTVGSTYAVAGDWARGNVGNAANVDFGVAVDGNEWDFNIPNSAAWQHFSQTFVASSSTVTLNLIGERNGSDCDPRVDNISLTAVPEPCTLVSLGAASLALLGRRRMKPRRA